MHSQRRVAVGTASFRGNHSSRRSGQQQAIGTRNTGATQVRRLSMQTSLLHDMNHSRVLKFTHFCKIHSGVCFFGSLNTNAYTRTGNSYKHDTIYSVQVNVSGCPVLPVNISVVNMLLCVAGWEWHDWNRLPNNLFPPLLKLKESGYDPFRNKTDCNICCVNMNC